MVWEYIRKAVNRLYGHFVKRPIQVFNVERRTEKLLDSQVKRVAPRHPHTQEKFDSIAKANPDIKKELEEKRDDLLTRLKTIKITSDEKSEEETDKSKLPKQRSPPEELVYGVKEPANIPVGKLSLRQIIDILSASHNNPAEFTIESASKHYKVDEEKLKAMLSYFHIFRVFNPSVERDDLHWHEAVTQSIIGRKERRFISETPKTKEETQKKKPWEK